MSNNHVPPLPPLEVPEDAPPLDLAVTAASAPPPEHATNDSSMATTPTALPGTQVEASAQAHQPPPPLGFAVQGTALNRAQEPQPQPQPQPQPCPPELGDLPPNPSSPAVTATTTPTKTPASGAGCSGRGSGNKQQARMETIWYGHLAKLKAYKATHNHVNVPRKSGPLGEWCRTQRRYYKMFRRGDPVPLTKERKKALDDLGFIWFPGEERKKRKKSDAYGGGGTSDHGGGGLPSSNGAGSAGAAVMPKHSTSSASDHNGNDGSAKKKTRHDNGTGQDDSSSGQNVGNNDVTSIPPTTAAESPSETVAAAVNAAQKPMTTLLENAHKAYNNAILATHTANEKLCDAQSLLERAQAEYQRARTAKTTADEALTKIGEELLERELEDNGNDEWVRMYQKLLEYKERHGDILFAKIDKVAPGEIEGGQNIQKPTAPSGAVNAAEEGAASNPLFDASDATQGNAEFGSSHVGTNENGNSHAVTDPMPVDTGTGLDKHGTEAVTADEIIAGIAIAEGTAASTTTSAAQTEAALAQWVYKLRKTTKKQCNDWRRQALDKIGFTWNQYDAIWVARYRELERYKQSTGHTQVPTSYPILGVWVGTQRKQYRLLQKGKVSHMTNARVEMLNRIGFVWEVNTWINRFEELKAFKESTGHFLVPTEYHNKQLRPWISTQRSHYRFQLEGKPSQLTQERIELLNSIGFPWKTKEDWQTRYNELVDFQRTQGHLSVPRSYDRAPKLYRWLNSQRMEFQKYVDKEVNGTVSRLKPDQFKLLEDLGFEASM